MNIKKGLILFLGIINFTFIQAQTTIRDSILYEGLWRNYRLFLPNGFNVNTMYEVQGNNYEVRDTK